jgi:UDP-N-acetylmuramoylalanine--D-glutamate ligase
MTGAILRAAGIPGGAGGNLGTPLSDLLELDGPEAVHAVELSSFQLETIDVFRADVAVILNLSPDHLDRHPSYESYASAKARLLATQEPSDAAVLNADDPESARFLPAVRGHWYFFSTRREVASGASSLGGMLRLRTRSGEEELMRASELRVPGEHNVANALAAALACRLVGCEPDAIRRGLLGYRALPHRLEHVATVNGVEFFNDSKATNLDATMRAVASFPPGSIHLILGGKDKGADWSVLAPLARSHVRRVLLVGQATQVIRKGLEQAVATVDCGTVPAAVRDGLEGARPGDVVLLAPGCASFDQYRNFEERGEDFRRAVQSLDAGEAGRA